MSDNDPRVETNPAQTSEADVTDVEQSEGGRTLYANGVDVLTAILNGEDFKKPTTGEWVWKRHGVSLPIRALSNEEFRSINRKNTRRLQVKNTQQVINDLDSEGYNNDIIEACLIDPNIHDPDVRRRIAAAKGKPDRNTVADCISHLFLPGEVTSLAMKIIELSGFNNDEEETVETLKV